MNILTPTAGRALRHRLERPAAVLRDVVIRLGAPNYPDDTMTRPGS